MDRPMPPDMHKTRAQRVGVFVDVQNMFYSAKMLYQSKVNYKRLLEEIVGQRELVRAVAYVVQRQEIDASGFIGALSSFGYEIRVKNLKIRPDGTAKGDWDMGIAIDSIALAPKLDTVVLVTGDGDFVPLVEMLKAHGCRVEVVSFRQNTAAELTQVAHSFTPIDESVLFRERRFEQAAALAGANLRPERASFPPGALGPASYTMGPVEPGELTSAKETSAPPAAATDATAGGEPTGK